MCCFSRVPSCAASQDKHSHLPTFLRPPPPHTHILIRTSSQHQTHFIRVYTVNPFRVHLPWRRKKKNPLHGLKISHWLRYETPTIKNNSHSLETHMYILCFRKIFLFYARAFYLSYVYLFFFFFYQCKELGVGRQEGNAKWKIKDKGNGRDCGSVLKRWTVRLSRRWKVDGVRKERRNFSISMFTGLGRMLFGYEEYYTRFWELQTLSWIPAEWEMRRRGWKRAGCRKRKI